MFKTFKWIYNLGKKHEEHRLYTAFIIALNNVQPTEFDMFEFDQKPEHTRKELSKRLQQAAELKALIESIFVPYVIEEPVQFNRVNRFK